MTAWVVARYGSECVTDGHLNVKGLNYVTLALGNLRSVMPWEAETFGEDSEAKDSEVYSMFPPPPQREAEWNLGYTYFQTQSAQIWLSQEIDLARDRTEFPLLPPRYQELTCDLLGFFAPGDGYILKQLMKMMRECQTFGELTFFFAQGFIECVHAESYGLMITSLIPDPERQKEVFNAVNDLPCVKAKGDFILRYSASDLPRGLRFIAAAAGEGIFFVSLFAIIFYLRAKGVMPSFCFLNEQVSKDETLHRDFMSEIGGLLKEDYTYAQAVTVLEEAVEIEVNHLAYILRKPVDTEELDTQAGLTVANLTLFVKGLADQILIIAGLPPHFRCGATLSWLADLPLGRKANFYECRVGNYKRGCAATALDWRTRVGFTPDVRVDPLKDPHLVDL